jgi:hypothetical protein
LLLTGVFFTIFFSTFVNGFANFFVSLVTTGALAIDTFFALFTFVATNGFTAVVVFPTTIAFDSSGSVNSDNGDIDAGKGSKTATSSPATFVTTDANGNTTVEVIASSAGSGIRTDTADPDGSGPQKAPIRGDAKLITPRGVVNASEGGIASNNLFIRALQVLNADNIVVQGVASGVPLAATSSLAGVSAGLSPDSVNSATAAVAESVAKSANQQQFAKPVMPSILNVEVISIGK